MKHQIKEDDDNLLDRLQKSVDERLNARLEVRMQNSVDERLWLDQLYTCLNVRLGDRLWDHLQESLETRLNREERD